MPQRRTAAAFHVERCVSYLDGNVIAGLTR